MAKPKLKKKKRALADKVATKKNVVSKQNAFEMKLNRQKHDVLGRRVKHDKGLPGVARSKAAAKVGCILLLFILLFY